MKEKRGIIHPGMKIVVMGFGLSGQAAMRFALSRGAEVLVSDSRDPQQFVSQFASELEDRGIEWEAGGHTGAFLQKADLVIVSPGISYWQPELQKTMKHGISCLGELAVAAPEIDVPVVAITGTNGKTTVTTMVSELTAKAGKKVFTGGNIGTPLLEYLLSEQKADILVLELSSFQLQFSGSFSPDVAVLLNITPDHLDHHASMEEYIDSKMRIFGARNTDTAAVLCLDDPCCASLEQRIPGRVWTYGHDVRSIARIHESLIELTWQGEQERYDLAGTRLDFPVGVSNSAAAILAARLVGIDYADTAEGIRQFSPLHHRLELVGEWGGVRYVDDSKATNTGAVNAALLQTSGKVVLIAGGRHKGEDYALMCQAVREKVRHVILIGEAADLIENALRGHSDLSRAPSMEEAVTLGHRLAMPGDTVLLSPACSSFDMFTSYSHRGDVFAEAVRKLQSGKESLGQGTSHG